MAQLQKAESHLHLHLYPTDTMPFTELSLSPRLKSIMLVKTVESVGVSAFIILHLLLLVVVLYAVVVVVAVVAGFCACH